MSILDRVCCVVDFDGFDVQVSENDGVSFRTEFLVRELGYVRIDPDQLYLPRSYRFDLRPRIDRDRLSDQDWTTLRCQSQKIGLPVFPSDKETDVVAYGCLHEILRDIHYRCRRTDADVVAYKGGHIERDVLEALDVPCADLQYFGCPKYDELIQEGKMYSALKDCGHHTTTEGVLVHCPLAEVTVFRDWYMLNFKKFSQGAWPGKVVGPCCLNGSSSRVSSCASSCWDVCTSSDSE